MKSKTGRKFAQILAVIPLKEIKTQFFISKICADLRPGLGLGLLICLPFLCGCSLLFVAKGGTQYVKEKDKAPEASSEAKEMNGPIVVEYKAQEGESFEVVSMRFFGNTTKASKIARDNHLGRWRKLKVGTTLKILNPLLFPGPDDLGKKIVLDKPKKSKGKGTPVPTPAVSTQPTPTAEPSPIVVEKIPRPTVNKAFAPGEKLKFEIRALSILGGYATLEVGDYTTVAGRPCEPLIVHANSVFPLTGIYPVDDVQTSYFDTVDFLTWKFENHVHEGDWKAHNLETYDQVRHVMNRIHNEDKPFDMGIPPFTQDIISCFYYFRLLPFEEGKTYEIPTQSSGQNYHLYVKVIGREKVTVPAGTYDCIRVKPLVKKDTVFRTKEQIDIWLTADDRHIPVKVQTGIVIGSIDADLLEARLPDLP